MNDLVSEVRSEFVSDVKARELELQARDEELEYALRDQWNVGDIVKVPGCECTFKIRTSYWSMADRRERYTGRLEECEAHRE